MKDIMAVFIGSGIGGVTRYGLSYLINKWANHLFPIATLSVNFFACLTLGVIIGLIDHKHVLPAGSKWLLSVGFCGGFSTFSTFTAETIQLFHQGNYGLAALYVISSIFICIGAFAMGIYLITR